MLRPSCLALQLLTLAHGLLDLELDLLLALLTFLIFYQFLEFLLVDDGLLASALFHLLKVDFELDLAILRFGE